MLMQAGTKDYAGDRLEDIVVVDQNGIIRYTTNWVDADHQKINQAIEALLNKYPIVNLSLREIYLGITLKVGQSKSTTFEISNLGDSPLEITGYTAPEGVTIHPPTLSLAANETQSVQVTLAPTQPGPFTGSVILNHKDQNVDTLELPFWPLTIEPGQLPAPVNPRTDFDE